MSINKIVSGRVAVLFVSLAGMTTAYAADGTLHATGDVTNSTCAVDVAGTTAQFGTIDLGSVKKSKIGVGTGSLQNIVLAKGLLGKPFYISFSNCGSANEQYTLTLSGSQTYYGSFGSKGSGNAELAIFSKDNNGDYKNDEKRPLKYGPYAVGADFRSHTMDVGLYRQYISSLTYGDLKYDVDYTVDFL